MLADLALDNGTEKTLRKEKRIQSSPLTIETSPVVTMPTLQLMLSLLLQNL